MQRTNNMNTIDIYDKLHDMIVHNEVAVLKNGEKYAELIDVHFDCDRPYIVDVLDDTFFDEWYEENYDPLIHSDEFGNQYNNCINQLISDDFSRRGIMQFINPTKFFSGQVKDQICTAYVQCILRHIDDEFANLDYIVNMRSNNAIEFRYDLKWQTALRNRIAGELSDILDKTVLTPYIKWNAGSFHVYNRDFACFL